MNRNRQEMDSELYKKINIKHLENKPVESAIKLALQMIMKGGKKG